MIAFATACRTLPFPDPHLEGEYGKAVRKWTRTVTLYGGLEARAFVRVIYLSPEFVNAQAQEISTMRAELPDQAAATLERLRDEYRQPSFFAVAYFPDRTANDLNEPDSVWRIALNLGLGEQKAEKVQRFERPFNAELRALYPYLDDYSTGYLLRFPEPEPPRIERKAGTASPPFERFAPVEARLVIAGAPGRMFFNWRLDGGAETPSGGERGPEDKPGTTPKP
jgi:hypothetical protein